MQSGLFRHQRGVVEISLRKWSSQTPLLAAALASTRVATSAEQRVWIGSKSPDQDSHWAERLSPLRRPVDGPFQSTGTICAHTTLSSPPVIQRKQQQWTRSFCTHPVASLTVPSSWHSKQGGTSLVFITLSFCVIFIIDLSTSGILPVVTSSLVNQRTMSTMAAAPHATVLTEDNINPNVKAMEYAVRGPLVIRATEIEKELASVCIAIWSFFSFSSQAVQVQLTGKGKGAWFMIQPTL